MEFDKVVFDDVDLDEIENINLDTCAAFNPDFLHLSDEYDIPVMAPLRPKTTLQISKDVESSLLSLLESNDRRTLLAITGERPDVRGELDPNLYREFCSQYAQAVLFNPGIKWYAKLVNCLEPESFKVEEGSLKLSISASRFKKVMYPFLGEFDPKFKECSPIVSLILSFAKKAGLSESTRKQLDQKQKKKAYTLPGEIESRDTSGDLDVSTSDIEDDTLFNVDEVQAAGEMHVDDGGSLNDTQVTEFFSSSMKFSDMSNKAIAEYLCTKGFASEEEAKMHLGEKGLDSQRSDEVASIFRYMRNNESFRRMPTGSLKGDCEIDFEITLSEFDEY